MHEGSLEVGGGIGFEGFVADAGQLAEVSSTEFGGEFFERIGSRAGRPGSGLACRSGNTADRKTGRS